MKRNVDESETLSGSLDDIRAFCTVIERGTISAAGRHLGETKGGVSRRISRLEYRLGSLLLARTPRAVTPTEEGRAFYARAREALALLKDAAASARQSQAVPEGHLRVTAPIDLGVDVLPRLIVRFRALHPQITVELLLTDTALDLAANRIDLALRATPGNLPDMAYRASVVARFQVALYAATGYRTAHGLPETPQALPDYDLIHRQASTDVPRLTLTDRRQQAVDVAIRPSIRATDYAAVHRLVLSGGGIGLIPDLVVRDSLERGEVVRVLPDWTSAGGTLYAITLNGMDAPARVRVFRAFLREYLATD